MSVDPGGLGQDEKENEMVDEWMISVDDHVIEPGHVWIDRLSASDRERGPRLVTEDGVATWVYEEKSFPSRRLHAAAGLDKEDFSPEAIAYEDMRPGCYDPLARLADMDRDGVLASLCFPSFPRFCGQTFLEADDKDLALRCVRAYNDWMIEDWCGSAPGRYIPMIILPQWNISESVAEIERTAALGARAITFSENPAALGLPSIHSRDNHWYPVFQAAEATGMPLCTHIGSSSQLPHTSSDAPMIMDIAVSPLNLMLTASDWLFSGVFTEFPQLKLCLSEGGIGWIPYLLERLDWTWDRQRAWASKGHITFRDGLAGKSQDGDDLPRWSYDRAPSDVFRSNMYGCFIDEVHGVAAIDEIGIDNVMIETDYPHTDSTWPHSQEIAKARLAHRTPEDRFKILQGNARRVFNFEPAPTPSAPKVEGV